MRFRTLAIAAALSAGLVSTGDAFVPQKAAEGPVVAAGRAPRVNRDISWTAPTGALAALPAWHAQWDRDTGVPLRLWGPSIAAPNAMTDAGAAESIARQFLATHLALLAPGANLGDFVLVANQLGGSGDVRTVAFEQRTNGLLVVGGSIGFSFKADHLIMVSSTALPDVSVRMPGGSLPAATLAHAAINWLASGGHDDVVLRDHGDRVILPIVRPRGNGAPDIEYRVAETVSVEATRDAGRWDVWLDASDASPIARKSTLMFASGTVLYDVADRSPTGTRSPQPAPIANHTVNGVAVTSGLDGSITWAGTTAATVAPGLISALVKITNKAGALVTDTLTLQPGGSVTWSKATDELADSQVSAFIYAAQAKAFARARLNPNLAWFNQQLSVNVNENQTCNAFSTGNDIHFFKKNTQCENTGRMADVVYHEFGHSVHNNSIIAGQGQFDRALSEGLADTLAASMTQDHGMGRGFFFTNAPLRDLDPVGVEKHWPEDTTGEVHNDGEIIGESLWDLRKSLIGKLGQSAGENQILKIYYGIMQRAADIPSSYAEALVSDDDDGNLANGTPNQCEITAAFALHGLADPTLTIGLQPPTRDNYTVAMTVHPPAQTSCPPPSVQSIKLTWAPKGGAGGELDLTAAGTTWSAQIPTQPDGTVVQYHVTVTLADGSKMTYPQNKADPEYQFYVGPVTKIACFDFEAGIGTWTHGGTPAANDEWAAGVSMGIGGDPKAAHGGTNVLGIDLGADDGLYMPGTTQFAESPEIDLQGNTAVRLQYYRWLNSEDAAYDQATIFANDQSVWTSFASPGMPTTNEVNHTDREWRFQDVDLSAQAATGKIKLKFQLKSDQGLELGGWTIDDVCVVAVGRPGPGTCGNGTVDTGETCDDGNTVDGDGCSATCQSETGAGAANAGCCSAGTNPAGPMMLSLFTIGLVLRRRRSAQR